jgi:acyl-coenzyme A synthetase/AMP-(fatty) acid ligase
MARAEALRGIASRAQAQRSIFDVTDMVHYRALATGSALVGGPAVFEGRSVLLATARQLTTALALIELDGLARRVVILPPDIDPQHLPSIAATAEIDAVVTDAETPHRVIDVAVSAAVMSMIAPATALPPAYQHTEWAMLTSGTTGVPKMVLHDLHGLTTALRIPSPADGADVWGTFYDIRRYGGLQIFLRAIFGGASLVLSEAGEATGDHLARLARHGVTHISGTPSQWRRALMSPAISAIAPRYVRLSGEIADQMVLDNLRAAFPGAVIGHAYASTEAGVGFDVNDGLAGFPARYVGNLLGGVELKIADGTLRVRSPGAASRYAGAGNRSLHDAEGFIDTGDLVERRGERYYFVGRKGGIINVGGLKVNPEEIEAVINRHPKVRMSLVRQKASPITGAIVVADVVLKSEGGGAVELKDDILKLCRDALPRHKVPAAISFVPMLAVAASGKLLRR